MGGESRKRGEVGGKDFYLSSVQPSDGAECANLRGPKNGLGGPKERRGGGRDRGGQVGKVGQLEGWLVEDGKGLNYSNSRTFFKKCGRSRVRAR